jgi:CrcB protein
MALIIPQRAGMIYLLIFLGAGLGGLTRFLVSNGINGFLGTAVPYATLIVNLSGCFIMGMVVSYLSTQNFSDFYLREIFVVGFLGGYTTFSTFSIEALELLIKHQWGNAMTYILGHYILSILFCALGFYLKHFKI